MDEAALSVLRRLDTGTELSGLVRLVAGRVLAERFLIDRLRAFHERYPAIDLEVIGGSRVVSLAKREADVALRYGSPKDSELVARRVATISFGLYASRAYRDELKAGQTPIYHRSNVPIGPNDPSVLRFRRLWPLLLTDIQVRKTSPGENGHRGEAPTCIYPRAALLERLGYCWRPFE
jgi:DNA-binding transcriptional LysR family regulator